MFQFYLLVKLRFSSQVWFQQIPVVFLSCRSKSAQEFKPLSFILIGFYFLEWEILKWNDMSERSKKCSTKYLPYPHVHLFCNLGRLWSWSEIQPMGMGRRENGSWNKERGGGGGGSKNTDKGVCNKIVSYKFL